MPHFSRAKLINRTVLRRFSTAVKNRISDEGDWFFSSEWWGSASDGRAVFRGISDHGNGVVSVVSYPSSRPDKLYWARTESLLREKFEKVRPGYDDWNLRIVGYEWRCLRFNNHTRQSTAKVMATCLESHGAGPVCFVQQAHCLAVPYVKSMISVGLTTISSCNYDLKKAVLGLKTLNVLCIGHGGGSIPLFLASRIGGAVIHVVEIDPLVISASIQAMGFPSCSVVAPFGERARSKSNPVDEVVWKGVAERLLLYESDAEKFILESDTTYDIVFIDAYDGEDIFPHKLWDQNSPFINSLQAKLHPEHGTVVVNLHSDDLSFDGSGSPISHLLPMGKYVSKVCSAYKNVLLGNGSSYNGLAYTVDVPWVCNTSLVVCKGSGRADGDLGKDVALNTLISKSLEVEKMLDLPFSCVQYLKRGFTIVD